MSKIGKLPIQIPEKISVSIADSTVTVSGDKGDLTFQLRPEIKVEVKENIVTVTRKSDSKLSKSLHGLTRSIIANMIKGVSDGHKKTLELVGVGYRASKQENDLILNVGYSHPVIIKQIPGINIEAKENKITVSGADKVIVGETAAKIRRVRPPEPYKGKGIRYHGEIIRRKAGKAIKTVQGT